MGLRPIDYTLNVQDPLRAVREGLEFGQAQALRPELLERDRAAFERQQVEQRQADTRFEQGNVLFEQAQQDRQTKLADVDRKRQEAIQMQADLEVLADNPTAAGYAELSTKYPQIASEMRQAWNLLDDQEQRSNLLFMGQLYSSIDGAIKSGNPEMAETMMEDRIEALNNTPGREDEAQQTQAYLETFRADPETARTSIGVAMSVLGNGQFDNVLGKGKAVQSAKAFKNGAILKLFRDGTREVTDPEGNIVTGAAAARVMDEANKFEIEVTGAGSGARETEKLQAQAELAGTAKAAEEAGKQSIAKSGDMFDQFAKTRTSISNIQSAIDAIDDGAKAGVIYRRIPNITKESASLQNALDRMGLDVISATTFGALSEGELRLAMETAAPRNLSAPALREWLLEKQTAQEKVAAMLLDAAQFLGTPGNTLADWIAKNQAEEVPASAPAVDPAAPTLTPDEEAAAFFGVGQ